MSTEILREAAALMRERARAARAGRWEVSGSSLAPGTALVVANWTDKRQVATCRGSLPEGNRINAEHIASWHPLVALAVADLLDEAVLSATQMEALGASYVDIAAMHHDAIRVARAYLGT